MSEFILQLIAHLSWFLESILHLFLSLSWLFDPSTLDPLNVLFQLFDLLSLAEQYFDRLLVISRFEALTWHVYDIWMDPQTHFLAWSNLLTYEYVTNYIFIFTLNLSLCLIFLSAIRGGVPSYRYDFLTNMGWTKFLGYVLGAFIFVFCFFMIH